jgi:hypothetical protein
MHPAFYLVHPPSVLVHARASSSGCVLARVPFPVLVFTCAPSWVPVLAFVLSQVCDLARLGAGSYPWWSIRHRRWSYTLPDAGSYQQALRGPCSCLCFIERPPCWLLLAVCQNGARVSRRLILGYGKPLKFVSNQWQRKINTPNVTTLQTLTNDNSHTRMTTLPDH